MRSPFYSFNRASISLLILLLLSALAFQSHAQTTRFVSTTGTAPAGGATSWATSTTDLQGVINASASGDQVWVAGGTYKPGGSANTNSSISFAMKNGVAIYGGFAGGESSLAQRSLSSPSSTTLSGDLGGTTMTGNSFHVINNANLTSAAILDGFVITAGNASESGATKNGGGINNVNSSPTFVNCSIRGNAAYNYGGGMFNQNSSPSLTNCTISDNRATLDLGFGGGLYNTGNSKPVLLNSLISGNTANRGGGIYNDFSSPVLTNCTVSGNLGTGGFGGGIYNEQSSPILTNCVISSNTTPGAGGGIYNERLCNPVLTNCLISNNATTAPGPSSQFGGGGMFSLLSNSPVLINCTLSGNTANANNGRAIYHNAGTCQLTNCIVYANGAEANMSLFVQPGSNGTITASFSLFQQGVNSYSGNNNLVSSASPFISTTDYRLAMNAVAINAGNTSANPTSTDLAGNARKVGAIDIGAYEYCAQVAITGQPASASSVTAGANVSVSVTVSGTSPTYRWYKNNLSSPVAGQTSATLTLTNVQAGDAGSYSVVVTGTCNSVTSTAFNLSVAPTQLIRYVKQGGSGTGDGTSWANASGDLQSQINIAGAEQVWVAGGRYTRTGGGSFSLKSGVAVYGGFAGGENSLGDRPGVNPVVGSISSTTLTVGSGGGSVIANSGVSNTARLDGVVITGGSSANFGGGISNQSSSPALSNCLISGNVTDRNGGGISNIEGIPALTNCVISNNSANLGGGIYNDNSSPVLTNCVIRGNSAGNSGGGIINESRSSPTLTNCVLSSNTANYGGGIYSGGSSRPNLRGCTLTGNRAGVGAALVNYSSSQPVLTNTILWDNQESANTAIDNDTGTDVTASYCLIGQGESSFTGSNNLVATTSPFVSGSDFQLTVCSVAIDAGNPNSSTATSGSTDLVGNPRFYQGGRIDIGAFEFQGTPTPSVAITQQPVSGSSVQAGASVRVPVSVSGTVSTYQWYKDNLGSPVSGQTSAPLTLTNVQAGDAGSYFLVVTGACNSVTSTAFSLTVSAPAQPIRYVKQGGTGDGTSWANASADLQSQIDIAGAQQVWVAQGTYKPGPATNTNRGISFVMKENVAIYGGFVGNESFLTDRRLGIPSSTTLSGDIGTVGDNTDNSNRVVSSDGLTASARLDGFVISGAYNPDGTGANRLGGGLYNLNSSPTLTNLSFSQNQAQFGAGMFNEVSSPVISNCDFSQNQSANQGGGIYNDRSSPVLTGVRFSQNRSPRGGGLFNDQSSPSLTNCSFSQNQASDLGGGIYNTNSSNPSLTNCLLNGNSATNLGGAFFNTNSSPRLVNCTFTANRALLGAALINYDGSQTVLTNTILWDNQESANTAIDNNSGIGVTANYCLIGRRETDYTGNNNLVATVSPFVSGSDFQLTACSVAIDAGDNGAYSAASGPATDLAGNPRPVRQIDMGAYEFQGTPNQPVAITQQPVSGSSVQAGASVRVPVSVSGTVSSYQWYKDNLSSPVTGQTSATLTLTNVQTAQAGSYSLVVTGTCNSVTSTAFSLTVAPAQLIRYVKQGGMGDGTSWANASGDLQSQINIAGAEQVWVAQGTYKPGPANNTNRGISFVMKENVAIYGGFVGNESFLTDRRLGIPSSTTLSGDIGAAGDNTDNSNRVVSSDGLTASARLDGFVITAANNPDGTGGGMYNRNSSPTLANLSFSQNQARFGGGIFNEVSNPSLSNSVFSQNQATIQGGAFYNDRSSPVLTNCTVSGNTTSDQGGGIFNDNSSPVLTNCLINSNSTTNRGGGLYNVNRSSPVLTNCVVSGNSAGSLGGGFFNDNSSPRLVNSTLTQNRARFGAALINYSGSQPVLTNTILWDNQEAAGTSINNDTGTGVTANYCLIGAGEADFMGTNNLTATTSPFVSGSDFQLTACSVAIDAGDNTAYTGPATDLAGNTRLVRQIDMGAYEFQGTPTPSVAITQQPASGSSVCVGSTVTAMVSVSGTVSSYQWYRNGQPVAGQTSATLSLTNVQTADAGSYSVVVTGSCNSVTSTAFSLTVNAPPTAGLTNNGPISCSATSVTLTASGGSAYQFSNGASQVGNAPTATVSSAGVYSVTVTSANGCTATASTTVTGDQSVPTAGLTNNGPISCSTTSVTLTASGGNTYRFSNGASQISNGPTATVSSAGFYSVTVTSANGCSSVASTTVTGDVSVPVASLTNNGPLSCSTTSVTLTASGGSSYQFSTGAAQIGSGPTATVSTAGVYSVTVISINGCSAVASTTVAGDQSVPTASLTNNGPISCSMTSVTLTASGGSTYRFSAGASQINGSNTATVSSAGVYSVTVTSANGCSSVASTTVMGDQSVPTASLTNNGPISCAMTSVTLTASGGSSYQFSTGANQIGNGPMATVSSAGVYSVTVTSANGCSSVASTTVTGDQSVPTASLTNNGPLSCSTTSVTLTASGGSSYQFSTGAAQIGSGPTATVSTAGVYSVTVISINGCSATASTTVAGDQSVPTASLTNNGPISCSMTSVTLTASGGSTYRFSAGASQINGSNTATVSSAGVYSVTVTSGNGCSSVASTTVIGDQSVPTAGLTNNGPISCAMTSVTLTASGGSTGGTLSYRFSSGASQISNGPTATVSTAGVYSVTVVSGNGCSSVTSTTVQATTADCQFALIAPFYNCLTGAITFRTQGATSPVEYRAVGITDWTTNPNQVVDLPVRQDANAQPLLLQARQRSALGREVTYTFDFRIFCNSTVPNQSPIFTQPPAQTATLGQAFAYRLPDETFRDLNGTAINFMATNLPDGLSYQPATRLISGTPTAVGSYTVRLMVADPLSLSAAGTLLIVVNAAPQPPVSTTVNLAPVFNGPLAAQNGVVDSAFVYTLSTSVFTDPNAGDQLTYTATGLPAGLSFTPATRTISGTLTATGTNSVTLTATDPDGLSASGVLTITSSASITPPVGPQPLTVLQPLYNCQTGAITFRTSGGDGSGTSAAPIYFSAVGVVGYSTQASYILDAAIRNDPNSQPLLIRATQNGVTASFLFDFRLFCNGTVVTNPPVFQGPLPVQTGTVAVRFSYQLPANAFQALNGGTLNYGITGLPPGLSFDATTRTVTGVPTQAGSFTATLTATDPVNQTGQGALVFVIAPAVVQPPVGSQPLVLLVPSYVCQTGSFTFRSSGGNGTPIEYMAVGITGFTPVAGPYTVLPAGDAQPFVLKARQSGVEVSLVWDFRTACSGGSRVGTGEAIAPWRLRSVGNPVTGELVVELLDAQGASLQLQLADEQGRLVSSRRVTPTAGVHRERFDVSTQGAGILLLRAVGNNRVQTLKVLKR